MKAVSPIVRGLDLPETVYAKDQPQYDPLPVFKQEDGITLSRWHLTWRERLRVLFKGDVYLWMMTFNHPLQPVLLEVEEPRFGESERIGVERSMLLFKIGTFRLYRALSWKLVPRIYFCRRSQFFAGGINGAWLKFSFEYDHNPRFWKRDKPLTS